MNISEEKIILTAYNVDTKPHITLNEDICNSRCKSDFAPLYVLPGVLFLMKIRIKSFFRSRGVLNVALVESHAMKKRLIGTTQKADMESFSVCRNY